jgi:hypothetical protein
LGPYSIIKPEAFPDKQILTGLTENDIVRKNCGREDAVKKLNKEKAPWPSEFEGNEEKRKSNIRRMLFHAL